MHVSATRLNKTALGACLLVFTLGILVLSGWILDLDAAKRLFSSPMTMKANVAAGLMLCSGFLALASWPATAQRTRKGLPAFAVGVILFAALTLSQDFLGWNLGIDELLFKDAGRLGRSAPGRMSPPTALCFMLLGAAMYALSARISKPYKQPLVSGLGVAVVTVGVASLSGNIFNHVMVPDARNIVPMAVDTALCFVLLGAVLLMQVRMEGGATWGLDKWTTSGFSVGMVLLLLMSTGSYEFTRQLQQQAGRVSHTQQVIQTVERLIGNLNDITTGLRGYLLSGDPLVLVPREALKTKVRDDLESLRTLMAEDAVQLQRLLDIGPLIADRFVLGEQLIATRREQGLAAAQRALVATGNVPLVDEVRRLYEEIRHNEYASLVQQQKRLDAISVSTFLVLPMVGLVSMTMLLLGLFFLNLESVERDRVNLEVAAGRTRFKAILDHLGEGVIVLDMMGNEIFSNPAALGRLGLIDPALPPADAGKLLTMILPGGAVLAHADDPIVRALRGEFVQNDPLTIRRSDTGQTVIAEFSTAPVFDPAGLAAFVIVTFRDVTERVLAAEARSDSDALFRAIFDASPDGIIVTDASSAIVKANPSASRMFGYDEGTMVGMSIKRLSPVIDGEGMRSERALLVEHPADSPVGQAWQLEGLRRDGTVLSMEVIRSAFVSPRGTFVVGVTRDISARLEVEKQSRLAYERFKKLFQGAPEAMSVTEIDTGRFVLVNDAFCQTMGYERQDLIGQSAIELGMWVDLKERDFLMGALLAGQVLRGLELHSRGRTGEPRELLCSADTIDMEGHTYALLMFRDITERKQAEARIEYLANHDGLTGLLNQNLMHDRITQAIGHAKRSGRQLALMYLDIDRFKVINDGYGHPFGDTVLKAVAERLLKAVRENDAVARQSGDEFLILLSDLKKFSNAYKVVQKILNEFTRPFQLDGREVHVSVSIGVSIYPQNGESADELINHADVAMYRSKELGRSTYQFFTQEMSQLTQQQVELETRLRVAIAQRELSLVYQPKVDLATGRIVGCEALLRWNHRELGAVSPAKFIPIAEESGLIVPIGDWVLRSACLQGKAWIDAGLSPVVMSVNVSARQFLQQDVVHWVFQTLAETGLPPELLELELTESLIAQDAETVIATVARLKASKVKVSIDDFGTGYSSLSYLKRFKVDTLKIDQSFVRNMLVDPEDAAIPLAVITLAHSLKLNVIAEGVETAEQCAFLHANGCDEIQGYYFSKPVIADLFAQMLAQDKHLEAFDATMNFGAGI